MPSPSSNAVLRIRGANENNLVDVDLDLPRGTWIAVTGPSGSGKTSLVFDTLVKEGERRFLGSLTPRARHFFGKLGPSQVASLRGLPATISVGSEAARGNIRSTVGTLSGILDLLRLAFAREAASPSGAKLTRGHFSFNNPLGQCEVCRGLGVEDRVDPAKLIADATKSLRQGALVPTLKSGYTVYSQVTLEVMDQICRAHDFDVDTPWSELTNGQRDVILNGTRALKVPFGKHAIESRMKWEGITARPREEGFYPGLVPVITETLKRNRNPNILRFVSSEECRECAGTRLAQAGRDAQLGDWTLPALLAIPVERWLSETERLPNGPVWESVKTSVEERIERLVKLGLGHLSLDRSSTTLSGGEAGRVRLAAQLGAGLTDVLFALDEPTLGLHPESQPGMRAVLDELVERGNSLITVEHDPDMVRYADYVIALGPNAGTAGGRVISTDLPGHPLTDTRQEHPLGRLVPSERPARKARGMLRLTGATLNNLEEAELDLGLGQFNVIMGPSGAGKSSLLFGTLLPALTGESGGPFEHLEFEGAAGDSKTSAVDARPIGKTPRSTPATWCGLFDIVRKRFGQIEESKRRGFTASHFSFNSGHSRCAECEGLGVTRLSLHLFEDVELTCAACKGTRYSDEILEVCWNGKTVAEVLSMTFEQALDFFEDEPAALKLASAMVTLGLGYLTLGQSSGSLSRGEAQRIKLGTLLGTKRKGNSIVLLDEPDRGLAPCDVSALLAALDSLVDAGHTIVAISHHRQVWATADRRIEVRGGVTNHSPTIHLDPISERRSARSPQADAACPLSLRGVRTHNLKNVDVSFPRGQRTVVGGLSGSGKTSLVFDTLAAEAQRLFAESLPFQVRRFLRKLPAPSLDRASGLTPTISLQQSMGRPSARSTVATETECGPILRLLFSRAGIVDDRPSTLSASHFSREHTLGACVECTGTGLLAQCDPKLLLTHPELPLVPKTAKGASALGGTRGGRFFSERAGQHIATLIAAASEQLDATCDYATLLSSTPWRELPEELQKLALFGTGSARYRVKWSFESKAEGEGVHEFEDEWSGFLSLVDREAVRRVRSKKAAEWTAAHRDGHCPTCDGAGIQQEARETRLLGSTLFELEELPLDQVERTLADGLKDCREEKIRATIAALLPRLAERLHELTALGLGHLALGRKTRTLSSGEFKRVRLASVLRSGLSGVTLALDEPTAGLHERDVALLLARLDQFQAEGNTIVIVSHRPSVLASADHRIEVGPGAGEAGGRIVAAGPPKDFTARELPLSTTALATDVQPSLYVRGARIHNLANIDIALPSAGFVAVTGVSGSGKSSLVFDVLGASVNANAPVGCDSIEGLQESGTFAAVHDARVFAGRRSALATLKLEGELAALFESAGLPRRAFKPGDAAGRCSACRGTGQERVAMDILADLRLPCETCRGTGFRAEVLEVKWREKNIAEWLAQPAALLAEALDRLPSSERDKSHSKLRKALAALDEVAALHIPLGRASSELSGGEAARVALASCLVHSSTPALYLFDEPSTGLHEQDLIKLVAAFRRLGERGDLVVVTEHRLSMIAAADWVIDLGPEGGPFGGRLIAQGPPASLTSGHTADALRARHA